MQQEQRQSILGLLDEIQPIPRRPKTTKPPIKKQRKPLRRPQKPQSNDNESPRQATIPIKKNKKRGLRLCNSCRKINKEWMESQEKEDYGHKLRSWMRKRGKHVTAKMTDEEKEMYRKLFNLLDEDGSGALDFDEIALALKLVGLSSNMSTLKTIFHQECSEEEELDFQAFLRLLELMDKEAHIAADNPDQQDDVLPFHLFLPAFSRKKNVEFVMSLSLVSDQAQLPYPLQQDIPLDFSSKNNNKPQPNPDCRCKSHSLLHILKQQIQAKQKQKQK